MEQAKNKTILHWLAIISLFLWFGTVKGVSEHGTTKTLSHESLIQKTDEIIKGYTEPNWFSGSVAIFKDSKVIYEKSFGYADIEAELVNTSSTKIRIGSINKHFTAALVMQRVQSGQLSLDDRLEKFNLGFPQQVSRKITVRHLLQHTSGFADIFNQEYLQKYRSLKSINDKLVLLINQPLLSVPGEKYNYSNYGYIVLGAILEKLEGESFQEIINKNILAVINAENTSYDLTENISNKAKSYHYNPMGEKEDKTGMLENITPDGGMYSTPYDIALFYSHLFYTNSILNDDSKAIIGNNYKPSDRNWPEILKSKSAHWSAYGGGPGVSAAAEILLKDKLMVVALANTDGLVAEYITQRIVDAYQGKAYQKPQLPLTIFAKKLLEDKGDKYFIANAKHELAKAGYIDFDSRPLNKLGFALFKRGLVNQAMSVFIANTSIFPTDANTFDSLGYAYEQSGNISKALLNYQKALSLAPNFESAKKAILRLNQ